MTSTASLCPRLAVLVLGIVIVMAFAWMATRESRDIDSSGAPQTRPATEASATLDDDSLTVREEGRRARVVADPATLETMTPTRWWAYRRHESATCCAHLWDLEAAGLGAPPQDVASALVVVVDRAGIRDMLKQAGPSESQSASLVTTYWTLTSDAAPELAATLVRSSDGMPLGPVGSGTDQQPVRLPPGMAFLVDSPGLAPVRGRLTLEETQYLHFELEAKCCLIARVPPIDPPKVERLELNRLDGEPGPQTVTAVEEVSVSGELHIGPLPRGEYSLWLHSPVRWLPVPQPRVTLVRPRQDAGLLVPEALHELAFRIQRPNGVIPPSVFVQMRLPGAPSNRDTTGRSIDLDDSGRGRIAQVRPLPVDLDFWTPEGHSRRFSGVQPELRTVADPLIVDLLPPGSLDVHVQLPTGCDASGYLVAFSRDDTVPVSARFIGASQRGAPERGLWVVALAHGSNARLTGLPIGSGAVHLISTEGCVLAKTVVEVQAGGVGTHALDVLGRGGVLTVRNAGSRPRRLGCLGEDGQVCARFEVPANGERRVLLPRGRIRIRELSPRLGETPAPREVRIEADAEVLVAL